jgi:hypothetical protein
MSEYIGKLNGWRIGEEDFAYLDSLGGEGDVLAMRGNYQETFFDPKKRLILRVENQGQMGSCQGNALSTGVEWITFLITGDKDIQLSRSFAYYMTQELDGIRGDKGSTISGGVKLASGTGIPLEKFWQYSDKYNPRKPDGWDAIIASATRFKIGNKVKLRQYDAVRTFLGSNQGPVHIGIAWPRGMDQAVLENYNRGSGGGHSVELICLSERKDSQGRPYVWMINSWGERWANGGWSEWSPAAIEQMFGHRFTEMIGISDLPNAEPRELSFQEFQDGIIV